MSTDDRKYAIWAIDKEALDQLSYGRRASGETATLLTRNLEIGSGIVAAIPHETSIKLVTAVGNERTYLVSVSGYTVEQLIGIIMAYADNSFDMASALIRALGPAPSRRQM